MEENKIFQEPQNNMTPENGKKPLDVPALVPGIVALAASPFIPLVSYVCGIIGLVFSVKHRKNQNTTAALIICIIGLICGVISHIYATLHILPVVESMLK